LGVVLGAGKPLFVKQKITATPLVSYISVSEDYPISPITIVAESMGYIPPYTAQLVVSTKKSRYALKVSSDYTRNSAVELFLKRIVDE
jgi:hypothetical protein